MRVLEDNGISFCVKPGVCTDEPGDLVTRNRRAGPLVINLKVIQV